MGDQVRQQQVPIIGVGHGVYSFVHIDDAAGATAAALECPTGSVQHRPRKPVPSARVADGVRASCGSTCATSRQRRRGASNVRPRRGLLRDEAQGRFARESPARDRVPSAPTRVDSG